MARRKRNCGVKFSKVICREVCRRLAAGEPLAAICQGAGMPVRQTINKWRRERPEFGAAMAEAREEGYEAIAAEALRIADTPREGETKRMVGGRVEITRADMLGHRKLQVDTRLKLLGNWYSRGRGNRVAEGDGGPEAGDPVRELMEELRRGEGHRAP